MGFVQEVHFKLTTQNVLYFQRHCTREQQVITHLMVFTPVYIRPAGYSCAIQHIGGLVFVDVGDHCLPIFEPCRRYIEIRALYTDTRG
jgi:hypothetical protein